MPIRIASLTHKIRENGLALHQAMERRIHAQGADQPPSDEERALLEERRQRAVERQRATGTS